MIFTAHNAIDMSPADAWLMVGHLDGLVDDSAARRLLRKILRQLSRRPLGQLIHVEIDDTELELAISIIYQTHTEEVPA